MNDVLKRRELIKIYNRKLFFYDTIISNNILRQTSICDIDIN